MKVLNFLISKNNFKEFKFTIENYNIDKEVNYTCQDSKLAEIKLICNKALDETEIKFYILELEKNMSKIGSSNGTYK